MLDAKGSNIELSLQKYFIKSRGKNSRVCGAMNNQVDMTPPKIASCSGGRWKPSSTTSNFFFSRYQFVISHNIRHLKSDQKGMCLLFQCKLFLQIKRKHSRYHRSHHHHHHHQQQ